MSGAARWPTQHPLCTCPPLTFATIYGQRAAPDRSKCAGGDFVYPAPIGIAEARRLVADLEAVTRATPTQ